MGMQSLGCIPALFGWVGVIIACALPMWRFTSFIGTNIVTSQIIWEGIWMSCVVESTGQMQCKVYDSMLALSPDMQAARALMVISIVVGITGILMAHVSGKCTNFIAEQGGKIKAFVAVGVVLIISGLPCLVAVSWTAAIIINDFYNPLLLDAQRRELGAAVFWEEGCFAVFVQRRRMIQHLSHTTCKDDKTLQLGRISSQSHRTSVTVPYASKDLHLNCVFIQILLDYCSSAGVYFIHFQIMSEGCKVSFNGSRETQHFV